MRSFWIHSRVEQCAGAGVLKIYICNLMSETIERAFPQNTALHIECEIKLPDCEGQMKSGGWQNQISATIPTTMKAGYTHNLCVDTHHDLCLLCASLCVPLRDFSLIKTDGAHNACVPVLPSGFEKENILMFARRTVANGGDIVTGDWSVNAKWSSAKLHKMCAAIHHNVPSGVVDGDSGGGNRPPSNCQASLWSSICNISPSATWAKTAAAGAKLNAIANFLPAIGWSIANCIYKGYFPHPIHQLSQQLALRRDSLSPKWRLFSHGLWQSYEPLS